MTNRVLLTSGGLWVSQPGVDVLTGTDAQMLFSMATEGLQVVQSGVVSDPGANSTTNVTIPDQGFKPFVIVSCDKYDFTFELTSNTNLRLKTQSAVSLTNDNLAPTVITRDGTVRYAVLNQVIE